MRNLIRYSLYFFMLSLTLSACTSYDDYKKYMPNGEIIYPGKTDTVMVNNGVGRVQLTWVVSDPKVVKSLIMWNGGADSLAVSIEPNRQNDTLRTIISDLPEGDYTFQIENYDVEGNRSLKTNGSGTVYGEVFSKTLLNRGVEVSMLQMGTATIEWMEADVNETGVVLKYTNRSGNEKSLEIPTTETVTVLTDYQSGTELSYRTGFIPDTTSIDVVYAQWETIPALQVVYRELDKRKFVPCLLPGDAGDAWGWTMPHLWDNITTDQMGYHTPSCGRPAHFTFDLGVKAQLSEVTVWQRPNTQWDTYYYASANIKRFEVWGTIDPAADGSWDNWTLLGEFESVKPSGLPLGENSSEDTRKAEMGESFGIPTDLPLVRYIRIRFIEAWDESIPDNHLVEIAFKGDY